MDHIQKELFTREASKVSGKTVESLAWSRQQRWEIIHHFGGELPVSIMRADRTSRGDDDLATGSYEKYNYSVRKGLTDDFSKIFDLSGKSTRVGACRNSRKILVEY